MESLVGSSGGNPVPSLEPNLGWELTSEEDHHRWGEVFVETWESWPPVLQTGKAS